MRDYLTVVFLLLSIASSCVGQSLIVNGGFEQGARGDCSAIGTGWESVEDGCVPTVQGLSSTVTHSGDWSQHLGGHSDWDYGWLRQVTPYNSVSEGTTYVIGAWIKALGIDNPAGWSLLRIEPFSNDASLAQVHMPRQAELNFEWRHITWEYTIPTGMNINRLAVVLTRHWGNGQVWYDDISVTVKNTAPPEIAIDIDQFDRTLRGGNSLPDDMFTLSNAGGGTLNYTISDNADWLQISPATGDSSGEANTITVHYAHLDTLPPGTHHAEISIVSGEAINSPVVVPVALDLQIPGDLDFDGDVDQEDFGRFQRCYTPPGQSPADPACEAAGLDDDTDVDIDDFVLFQGCMTGANIPAVMLCLP